jgi:hypothetical protein
MIVGRRLHADLSKPVVREEESQMRRRMRRLRSHEEPYLDHIERLKGGDYVFHLDSSLLRHFINRQIFRRLTACKQMDQNVSPIASIRDLTQIRQWLFRRSRFVFTFGELVRERYNELSIARLLVLRKGKNAGEVVSFV